MSYNRLWALLLLCTGLLSCDPDRSSPPTNFSVNVKKINLTTVEVFWDKSLDPDGGEVTYDLFLEDNPILSETT